MPGTELLTLWALRRASLIGTKSSGWSFWGELKSYDFIICNPVGWMTLPWNPDLCSLAKWKPTPTSWADRPWNNRSRLEQRRRKSALHLMTSLTYYFKERSCSFCQLTVNFLQECLSCWSRGYLSRWTTSRICATGWLWILSGQAGCLWVSSRISYIFTI